jgi:hypothetical protein
MTKLSDRLRANVECAPWVVSEVVEIEAENAALRAELSEQRQQNVADLNESLSKNGVIYHLRAKLLAANKKHEETVTINERLLSAARCAEYELAAAKEYHEAYREEALEWLDELAALKAGEKDNAGNERTAD